MQPLLLGFIVFTVVALLGVGLFYVGTKLLYNVSTDVANAITPTTTTSSPNGPNEPDKPNIPTVTGPTTTTPPVTTTPLPPGKLETWSDTTFQGEKLDDLNLAGLLLPYNSFRVSINTKSQSIRFAQGYTVYLAYYDSTSQPVTADDVRSAAQNTPLNNETTTIPIVPFKTPFIGVYSNATTPAITTPTTTTTTTPAPTIPRIPDNTLRVFNLENYNYSGGYTDYTLSNITVGYYNAIRINKYVGSIDYSSITIPKPNAGYLFIGNSPSEQAIRQNQVNIFSNLRNVNTNVFYLVYGYKP